MANLIRIVDSSAYLDEATIVRQRPQRTYTIGTTSEIVTDSVQVVGTTHAVVAAGSVTDTCYCELENLHATATVQYGYDTAGTFTAIGSMSPGDPPARLGRLAAVANIYIKSSAASTPVRVYLAKIA